MVSVDLIQMLLMMNSLRISSVFMDLGSALLAAAIFVFSLHKTENKVFKIAKGGIAFTVAFSVLALMQMVNLYGVIYEVLTFTDFLWYIFLTLIFLFAFFDKDFKPTE